MSPLVHVDINTHVDAVALLRSLYKLDMDLTDNKDFIKLEKCFELWRDEKVFNQPLAFKVDPDNNVIFEQGDRFYTSAMERWKTW